MLREIKNFFKWGWRCRNTHPWDWMHLLHLMEMQSKDMHEEIEEANRFVGCEQVVRELKIVELLCKRLQEDDYDTPFPEVPHKDWIVVDRGEWGVRTKSPYTDKEHKMQSRVWKREDEMRQHDLEYLTRLMKRRLFNWWD